jgi:amino acid permease
MNINPEAWSKAISSLGGQLVEALRPVAAKLGVAAEHLYGVLVKQALVDSISNIMGWGLFAGFVIYIGYRLRLYAEKNKGELSTTDQEGWTAVGWVVTTFGVIVMAITIGSNISGILNPEYFAIKELMDAVTTTCTK